MGIRLKEELKQVAVLSVKDGKIQVKEYSQVGYNEKTNKYRVKHDGYSCYCLKGEDYEVGRYCMVLNLVTLPDACLAYAQARVQALDKDDKKWVRFLLNRDKNRTALRELVETLKKSI